MITNYELLPVLLAQSVPWAGTGWADTAVAFVLALASLVVFAIIITKSTRLYRSRRNSIIFAEKIRPLLLTGKWEEAADLAQKYSTTSHTAKIVRAGFEERRSLKSGLASSQVAKHMHLAMEIQLINLQADYDSGLEVLDALGRTAPFIGALGGSAVTFVFGIALAIPTIWFLTRLRRKTTLELAAEMKMVMNELTNWAERN